LIILNWQRVIAHSSLTIVDEQSSIIDHQWSSNNRQ